MHITVATLSESGDRDYNEDKTGVFTKNDGCCIVLADGLGGHGKGEVASAAAVEAVSQVYLESDQPEMSEMFESAQDKVTTMQKESNDFYSMKTTLVTAVVSGDAISWGHIGDSRLYFFKDKKLVCRTLDHSVPQMLVNAGEIKESQIRGHVDRNKLLRVVGTQWDSPRYQLQEPFKLTGCEQLLLCSDGFWEYIDEKKMVKLLKKSKEPNEWLEAMKKVVLSNGKGNNMDNFSAICAFIEE